MFSRCCVCESRDIEETINQIEIQGPPLQDTIFLETNYEDKEKERELLIDMVRQFAHEAVNGSQCELNDHINGRRTPCTYFIDRDLQKFSLQEIPAPIVIDLFNLSEIYTFEDMKKRLQGLVNLSEAEKERSVMIEYVDTNQYMQRLCLLLSSNDVDEGGNTPADRFSKSLKILRVHSKAQSPRVLS